jgi:hypothetical protein
MSQNTFHLQKILKGKVLLGNQYTSFVKKDSNTKFANHNQLLLVIQQNCEASTSYLSELIETF